jgi:hypothetical protein
MPGAMMPLAESFSLKILMPQITGLLLMICAIFNPESATLLS